MIKITRQCRVCIVLSGLKLQLSEMLIRTEGGHHIHINQTYHDRVECTIQRDICSRQIVANDVCAGHKLRVQLLRKGSTTERRDQRLYTYLDTGRLHDVSLDDLFDPAGHFSLVLVGLAKFWSCTQHQIF